MKVLSYLLICFFGCTSLTFGAPASEQTDQIGFQSFQKSGSKIQFSCEKQCIYVLGIFNKDADYILLKGGLKGTGKIGFGFFNGQEVIPGDSIQVGTNLLHKFYFSRLPFFSELSTGLPVVIFVEGTISGDINSTLEQNSLQENITQLWSDFWKTDTFTPYTINLLYGPKVNGASINGTLYLIFLLVVLGVLVRVFLFQKKKENGLMILCIAALILWSICDLRMTYEINGYYIKDYQEYSGNQNVIRNFRDRGDFNDFMDFTQVHLRDVQTSIEKPISFYSSIDWPYFSLANYFLIPYKLENANPNANVILFYKYQNLTKSGSTILLDGKTLGDGNWIPFSEHASIFIRK